MPETVVDISTDKDEDVGKDAGLAGRDWETSTFAGLMFALKKYRERLKENRGYKLNAKPREIDVRIIDQEYGGEHMDNAIGHLFERHNLVELKNPYEALNIDVMWKGISYAAQYKSSGYDDATGKKGIDAIPIDDVTLTFLRISKPEKLFSDLKDRGYKVDEAYPGVYYISGMVDIKMQVVVGTELVGKEYTSLRIQKPNANEEDVREFIRFFNSLKESRDKDMADAIIQISISENKGLYDQIKEGDSEMSRALEELMEDRVLERVNSSLTADREDKARRMIRKNKPVSEIVEFTDVNEARISELAADIGVALVTS